MLIPALPSTPPTPKGLGRELGGAGASAPGPLPQVYSFNLASMAPAGQTWTQTPQPTQRTPSMLTWSVASSRVRAGHSKFSRQWRQPTQLGDAHVIDRLGLAGLPVQQAGVLGDDHRRAARLARGNSGRPPSETRMNSRTS